MIFVTGGTGLVGAHLLFELTSSGKKVKALKRENSNLQQVLKSFSYYTENPYELYNKIEWVNGDMLDYFQMEEILEGITEIYHCAAIISFRRADHRKMIRNNVERTSNIVNAAIKNGVKKICHVSSISALAHSPEGSDVTETSNWEPSKKVSGYSKSKFLSEMEIWCGIEEGLDAIIVNPSIILGPTNWETGSARIFKAIWNRLPFYTRGITGYVDVKDVVSAMIKLMQPQVFDKTKNQRYIINAENISFYELFAQIARTLEKPAPKYLCTNTILKIACTLATITSLITRKPPVITPETIASSNKINKYDGSKITRMINFQYTPIVETIKQTATFLKNDMLRLG
ncbi:MAG: NAD-dependent epimerase/dehydratase family protein [Bacteroidales bacterium]|jgi:nucleoside-diphosphate-sugar epimerase|nr:NAD-dependent epimerase/dehydratase family protein [Bacteroidales bacterium]